jgi:hypothetical protein
MFKAVVNMLTWLQKNRLRNGSVDTHFANLTRRHEISACAPRPYLLDLPCFRADVRREERSVPLIERNRALEVRGTRAQLSRPACHKTPIAKSNAAQLSALALHLPTPRATG